MLNLPPLKSIYNIEPDNLNYPDQIALIQPSINDCNNFLNKNYFLECLKNALINLRRSYHQNPFAYLIELANYAQLKNFNFNNYEEILNAVNTYPSKFNYPLVSYKGGDCYDMAYLLKVQLLKKYNINSQIIGSFQIEPETLSPSQKAFLEFDHTCLLCTICEGNTYKVYYLDPGFVIKQPMELKIGEKMFGMGQYTITDIDSESFITKFISPSGRSLYRKFFFKPINVLKVFQNKKKLIRIKRNMPLISALNSQGEEFWMRFIYSRSKFNSDISGLPWEFTLSDLNLNQISLLQKVYYSEIFEDLKRFQSIYKQLPNFFWKV